MKIYYIFSSIFCLSQCKNIEDIVYYPSGRQIKLSKNIYKSVIKSEDSHELYFKSIHKEINENIVIYKNTTSHDALGNLNILKRSVDEVFRGNPKTREELWHEHILNENEAYDQSPSLIQLVYNITLTYLYDCKPVLLYDRQIKSAEGYLFRDLLKNFPVSIVHGYIEDDNRLKAPNLLTSMHECLHYILFVTDVKSSAVVMREQTNNKLIVITKSSQWAVQEFLSSSLSRLFVDLLVIGQSFEVEDNTLEAPYILYTHILYTDGIGTSKPIILCSWKNLKFSRHVNLFPQKITAGYASHRFLITAANQPPFVFKKKVSDEDGGNPRIVWDGIEIRLLRALSELNNFTIEIVEPKDLNLGPGDAVVKEISAGRADIGVAGLYLTNERIKVVDTSFAHSQDCAAFVTLSSTALPRYRAILGPFHWHVWVALTFTYLIAIFPLAFSDKHTLRHLVNNTGEIENMFWYVFGTFTNCFTFVGKNSWSKTNKITTRLLVGWYWMFTIIITSCYTGSIIAFVTLPIYPETVDSVQQLLTAFYRVGTLDRGGWERWFINSSDVNTNKLVKKLEFVEDIETGIRNVTKAFFWPYAFLGSKSEMEYLIQANFSMTESKRAVLHISNECFAPFGVVLSFPKNSLYAKKINNDIMKMYQCGLIHKFVDEVRWEMQRSSKGKLLSVGSTTLKATSIEEKGLTLEDTQGMFLLLAAGFILALIALASEIMGGFSRRCARLKRRLSNISSGGPISKHEVTADDKNTLNTTINNVLNSAISIDSNETLDGQIINVTEDDIIVHAKCLDNYSKRSSSVDMDIEINKIFEAETTSNKHLDWNRQRINTASRGVFGDVVY